MTSGKFPNVNPRRGKDTDRHLLNDSRTLSTVVGRRFTAISFTLTILVNAETSSNISIGNMGRKGRAA